MFMQFASAAAALAVSAGAAIAAPIQVSITGEVEFNLIGSGPFGRPNIPVGSPVSITFDLDSSVFTNSGSFPTRGYHIDQSSWSFQMGAVSAPLRTPQVNTPYFVLRNNDPGVDGFFIADSVDGFTGVELNQAANLDPFFRLEYHVTYGGTTLPSLDIEDAIGTYDFTGLTVFGFTVNDASFEPIGILFEQMTITPAPASVIAFAPLALVAGRRRRD